VSAIDQMAADERAIFVRMIAAAALAQVVNDERQQVTTADALLDGETDDGEARR
jgi:hypothetical protein